MSNEALTPYAGTSGWSGSDASRERVEREDSNGTTSERQRRTLGYVQTMGYEGLTVADLRDLTNWHHGQASAALSVLHKEGKVERLAEKRDRCQVYVLPEYVNGRETRSYRRNKPKEDPNKEAIARVQRVVDHAHKYGSKVVLVSAIERALRGD